jgi:hypothetical protein
LKHSPGSSGLNRCTTRHKSLYCLASAEDNWTANQNVALLLVQGIMHRASREEVSGGTAEGASGGGGVAGRRPSLGLSFLTDDSVLRAKEAELARLEKRLQKEVRLGQCGTVQRPKC